MTDAAIRGKEDDLIGLKENVIIGKLIPAGTGMKRYRSTRLSTDARIRAAAALAAQQREDQLTLDEINRMAAENQPEKIELSMFDDYVDSPKQEETVDGTTMLEEILESEESGEEALPNLNALADPVEAAPAVPAAQEEGE